MRLKEVILKHKEEFLNVAKKMSNKPGMTSEKQLLINEKRSIEDHISQVDRYIKKAFEEKVRGSLPDSVYKPMVEKYTRERNDLAGRLKSIDEKITEQNEISPDYYDDADDFIKKIELINPINCVEAVNLKLLISRIYIVTDGKKKRREKMNKTITIVYRKIDNVIKEFLDEK